MTLSDAARQRADAVEATREAARGFLRDDELMEAVPMVICQCGRLYQSHRIDLKRARMDDGKCDKFDPATVAWPVRRFISVPVPIKEGEA